jgi:hypothetical protein
MKSKIIKKDHWPEGTYIEIDRSIFPDNPTITAYENNQPIGEYETEQDAVDTINTPSFEVRTIRLDPVTRVPDLTRYCNKIEKEIPQRKIKKEEVDWHTDGIHGHYFDPILNAHHNVCKNGCCENALHLTFLE